MDYVTVRGKSLQDCLMQMKMKYGPEAHVYEHKVKTEGGVLGTGFLANKIYEITVAIPEKESSKEQVDKKLNDLRELLRRKSAQTQVTHSTVVGQSSQSSHLTQNIPTYATTGAQSSDFGRKREQSRAHMASVGSSRNLREIPQFSQWVQERENPEYEDDLPEEVSRLIAMEREAGEDFLPQEDIDAIEDEHSPDRATGIETGGNQSVRTVPSDGLSFVEEMISRDHEESRKMHSLEKTSLSRRNPNLHGAGISPSMEKLRDKLNEEGLSRGYLEDFIPELEQHLSPLESGRYSTVCEKAVEILESRIRTDSDLFSGTKKGKRKVIFIIGPTGSGKTTTIAKLAAKYYLHMGRTVSLYTTDNFRIAAVEQLKRYADTMDLPFYAVKDIRKFREALLRDGSELVLVDTAGYSHKDRETLEKMKEYYDALGEKDQPENILVLSATVSYPNAREVLRAYEELGYNRVILSKIDETDYLGSFLELADTNGKEFAYYSVGQDVPFDILGAEKKLLAECVVYPEKMKGIKGEVFSRKS